MKYTIILFLILIGNNFNSQVSTCEEKVNTLLIDKIKNYPSKNLIPYYSEKENKWGFFDRISKKTLTQPIFKEAKFFHPHLNLFHDLETNSEQNGCDSYIFGSIEKYKQSFIRSADYNDYEGMFNPPPKKSYKEFVKENVSGFEVDNNGNLTNFNPKFYNRDADLPIINSIFKFKEKYYAIVDYSEKNVYWHSIIDQYGNTFKGFEKLTTAFFRKQMYSNDDNIWFLIQTSENQYVFKSLINGVQLPYIFNESPNWHQFDQTLGYGIMKSANKDGIFDFTTMNWKIKPSKKNDFSYLNYSCDKPLLINYEKDEFSYNPYVTIPTEMIIKNRENSFIYIQNSKNQCMDLNLKIYKPKK